MKRLCFLLFFIASLFLCLSACQGQKPPSSPLSPPAKEQKEATAALSVRKPPPPSPTPKPAPSPPSVSPPSPAVTPSSSPGPSGPKNTLYILMYHSVAEDGTECNNWTVTTGHLRKDLEWLKNNGYTTLLPRDLTSGEPLPEKAVMLTFDDGYTDNYTHLYPLLQEYEAKAVISVVTKWISDPYATGFMSWEQCREMAESGLVEFGSHSDNLHANGITRLDGETAAEYEARVLSDLQQSIDRIEEHLGVSPTFFAYPHGKTEPWAEEFLQAHFSVTVTTVSAIANLSGGTYQLPRYNVTLNRPASYFLK